MINEIWKPVKHYEGFYEVSNYGRVKSIERDVFMYDGTKSRHVKEHFVPHHDNGKGYLYVILYKNNVSKREYVHRIVAMAFIPNPDNLPQVNHKDEDKQNNYVDNLEWCTCKYNNNYGNHISNMVNTCRENGTYDRFSKIMKENNPNARKVICDGIIFNTIKDCAEHYNINYNTFKGYIKNPPNTFKELGLDYAS